MSCPSVFSLLGPLPRGRLTIEASAGTGKTYTLAGLVARYVAEDEVPIEKILIVTFTRAAAAELRDRVRTRLIEAVAALRDPPELADTDDLLALIGAKDRERRLKLLERSVVDFDAATITTIHGFAQQVLSTLGSAAPGDLDATLVEDTSELLQSVCADVLSAESFAHTAITDALPSINELFTIAAKVLGNPDLDVVPSTAPADSTPAAARLRRLVDRAVELTCQRRRAAGTVSFDDLLTQLRDALHQSPAAVATLHRRFRTALIDEFQDTDPVQWDIFSTLFGGPGDDSTLILVADPKQAIFAFRGANVHTYLQAAHQPGTRRSTLEVNWRSDGALINALDRLLSGASFGDREIAFVPVKASDEHDQLRLSTAAGAPLPALRLRLAIGKDLPRIKSKQVVTDEAENAIAADLADQVRELLETAWLPAEDKEPRRRLRPSDVAVLVAKRAEAGSIQAALRQCGIPAVTTRGESVLRSPAATQWRWLLTALIRPSDPTRARTAAMSWFFGWSVADLDADTEAGDAKLAEVQEQLTSWSETLEAEGTVELCARIWSESRVTARVLARSDGDRNLTDLDHVASLLQGATASRRPTALGLKAALLQLENISGDPENDPTARQIESEAEAVQIITIHAAKGLEFPVTCVPTLWRYGRAVREVVYQDPDTGRRTFDIANDAKWPSAAEAVTRKRLAETDALGENLRLAYVALTRAKHSTLLWWSRARFSELTGLARILFARREGLIDEKLFEAPKVPLPADDSATAFLGPIFEGADDAVVVDVTGRVAPSDQAWHDPDTSGLKPALGLATLEREPDRSARRWSFSAIINSAREIEIDTDDETLGDAGAGDEQNEEDEAPEDVAGDPAAIDSDLPLGAVPGGRQFGTLVHEVLEHVDFMAPDVGAQLRAGIEDRLRWNPWPVSPAVLERGLLAAIETPLGQLFDGRRLRDFSRGDCLGELSFELRLGTAGCPASDHDLGELICRHLPGHDPLRPWAERLAAGLFRVELAGHLTGSIDLIVRVRGADGAPEPARFVVIDYKTNVLAEPGRLPQSLDYHPSRLPAAMTMHHYPLQALVYSVALHRYLRWRVPGYDPGRHLGGTAYLFVRGMAGAATPVIGGDPHGVFNWRVPPALITELSDLLDGAAVAP